MKSYQHDYNHMQPSNNNNYCSHPKKKYTEKNINELSRRQTMQQIEATDILGAKELDKTTKTTRTKCEKAPR